MKKLTLLAATGIILTNTAFAQSDSSFIVPHSDWEKIDFNLTHANTIVERERPVGNFFRMEKGLWAPDIFRSNPAIGYNINGYGYTAFTYKADFTIYGAGPNEKAKYELPTALSNNNKCEFYCTGATVVGTEEVAGYHGPITLGKAQVSPKGDLIVRIPPGRVGSLMLRVERPAMLQAKIVAGGLKADQYMGARSNANAGMRRPIIRYKGSDPALPSVAQGVYFNRDNETIEWSEINGATLSSEYASALGNENEATGERVLFETGSDATYISLMFQNRSDRWMGFYLALSVKSSKYITNSAGRDREYIEK